jgi:hypothetical protein
MKSWFRLIFSVSVSVICAAGSFAGGNRVPPGVPASGLVLWLDAADLPPQNSGSVLSAAWPDASGSGNHAALGIAPRYRASARNGYPAVRFGVDESYLLAPVSTGPDVTVFAVFTSRRSQPLANYSDTLIATRSGAALHATRSAEVGYHYPNLNAAPAGSETRLNGLSIELTGADYFANRPTLAAALFRDIEPSSGLVIGAANETGAGSGANDLQELMVYNRTLEPEEVSSVERYLAAKFDLVICQNPDDPIERINLMLGSQQVGDQYSFGEAGTQVLDAARAIFRQGSRLFKIALSSNYVFQNRVPARSDIDSLATLVEREPSIRAALEMPFTDFLFWAAPFSVNWRFQVGENGLKPAAQEKEYREIYDLAKRLLEDYSGTGKSFYLGNWEGDWMLFGGPEGLGQPIPPERIQAMIDWANVRQRAIDDAKRETPHHDVNVWHYLEMNQGMLALNGEPCVTNSVIPFLDKLDFISFSAYTVNTQTESVTHQVLDYLQSKLKPDPTIPGNRIIIGEYGYQWTGSETMESFAHRHFSKVREHLSWPAGPPRFALIWQFYNRAERDNGINKEMRHIAEDMSLRPLYFGHENYYRILSRWAAAFAREFGRPPNQQEIRTKALEILSDVPLVEYQPTAGKDIPGSVREVNGPVVIERPLSPGSEALVPFQAEVENRYGLPLGNSSVAWSIAPAGPGVSVDAEGRVRVTGAALPGRYAVRASLPLDGTQFREAEFQIAAPLPSFRDPLSNWNFVAARTPDLAIRGDNIHNFEGDTGRVRRTSEITSVQSFDYHSPGFSQFSVRVFSQTDPALSVEFWVSPDGIAWTPISTVHSASISVGTTAVWNRADFQAGEALPPGTAWLRIALKGTPWFSPQIGEVAFYAGTARYADSISIQGPDTLRRPEADEAAFTYSYVASVTDSNGMLDPSERVVWSLEQNYSGVSLSPQGALTIGPGADAAVEHGLVLQAAAASNGAAMARKVIRVFALSGLTAEERWRWENFAVLDGDGVAAETADPDGDGIPNRLEFALGGDPLRPSSARLPKMEIIWVEGRPYAALRVERNPLATTLNWVVETSSDLRTWRSGPGFTAVELAEPTELLVRALQSADDAPAIFLRLRLE